MPVVSLGDYVDVVADSEDKFHGNQVVYVGWDKHLMCCATAAYPLPPDMPFGTMVEKVLPEPYALHPHFKEIKWDDVVWLLDNKPFTPDMDASLHDNGIHHKSCVRFQTPGLEDSSGM